MMNALRLKNGVDKDYFFARTGLLYSYINQKVEAAIVDGLLIDDESLICPSEHGYLFLNELLERFMPENFPELDRSNTIPFKSL